MEEGEKEDDQQLALTEEITTQQQPKPIATVLGKLNTSAAIFTPNSVGIKSAKEAKDLSPNKRSIEEPINKDSTSQWV